MKKILVLGLVIAFILLGVACDNTDNKNKVVINGEIYHKVNGELVKMTLNDVNWSDY